MDIAASQGPRVGELRMTSIDAWFPRINGTKTPYVSTSTIPVTKHKQHCQKHRAQVDVGVVEPDPAEKDTLGQI